MLVSDVPKVLAHLGMPPVLEVPWDPRTASDVLAVVDINLEGLKEAYE
jgi:hypothetical protein